MYRSNYGSNNYVRGHDEAWSWNDVEIQVYALSKREVEALGFHWDKTYIQILPVLQKKALTDMHLVSSC